MLKTIIVVGIPGVGKTTVLNIAVDELRAMGYSVMLVNFGDLMLETLKQRGLVRSRDDIRNLPLSIQREVQREVADKLGYELNRIRTLSGSEAYVAIVDTHAVVRTNAGYWPGLPSYVITQILPDCVVVIEADVNEIIARQVRDVKRMRSDYSDASLLNELLILNRMFAISSANIVGAPIYILRNREGKARETALELTNLVTSLRG